MKRGGPSVRNGGSSPALPPAVPNKSHRNRLKLTTTGQSRLSDPLKMGESETKKPLQDRRMRRTHKGFKSGEADGTRTRNIQIDSQMSHSHNQL